jgi:hypothetical protein
MRCRGTLLALVCAVLLALPASALAQSAGDNQYQDPFAGQAPSNSQPKQTPSTGSRAQVSPQSQSSAPSTASPSATAGQSQSTQGDALPRTGFPAGLPLVYGLVLLLSGVALRRGARPRIR